MEKVILSRRASLAAFAIVVTGSAAAHPQDKPNPEAKKVEGELMAFREAMKAAMNAKDVAKLRPMYTDAFTHTHGSGKVDGRDARIISLLAGDPVIEDAPMSEVVVRVHGPDTAILSARSPILNKAENKMYDFRWTQVDVRETGAWKLAVSQATRLPPGI
jgi:hypothetical protein